MATGDLGVLEAGKLADLVIVDLRHAEGSNLQPHLFVYSAARPLRPNVVTAAFDLRL